MLLALLSKDTKFLSKIDKIITLCNVRQSEDMGVCRVCVLDNLNDSVVGVMVDFDLV